MAHPRSFSVGTLEGRGADDELSIDDLSVAEDPKTQSTERPSQAIPSGGRIAYLDGARALAALYVLLHHAYCMAYPLHLNEFPQQRYAPWLLWVMFGKLGVTVFIVLAGFSLALGVANRDGELPGGFRGYMRRRARRIIPPYWIAIALTIPLSVTVLGRETLTHWDNSVPPDLWGWLTNVALLQDVVSRPTNVAYTFWSVPVEFHIYLLVPFMLLIRRASNWTFAVIAGLSIGAMGVGLRDSLGGLAAVFPEYYVWFVVAFAASVGVKNAPNWMRRLPWELLPLGVGAALCWSMLENNDDWVSPVYGKISLLVGLFAVSLLVALSFGRMRAVARALSCRPLARIGECSYTLYLIHAQLLALTWVLVLSRFELDRAWQLRVGWLVVCPLIVTIAWLASRFMEKPFALPPSSTVPSSTVRASTVRDDVTAGP